MKDTHVSECVYEVCKRRVFALSASDEGRTLPLEELKKRLPPVLVSTATDNTELLLRLMNEEEKPKPQQKKKRMLHWLYRLATDESKRDSNFAFECIFRPSVNTYIDTHDIDEEKNNDNDNDSDNDSDDEENDSDDEDSEEDDEDEEEDEDSDEDSDEDDSNEDSDEQSEGEENSAATTSSTGRRKQKKKSKKRILNASEQKKKERRKLINRRAKDVFEKFEGGTTYGLYKNVALFTRAALQDLWFLQEHVYCDLRINDKDVVHELLGKDEIDVFPFISDELQKDKTTLFYAVCGKFRDDAEGLVQRYPVTPIEDLDSDYNEYDEDNSDDHYEKYENNIYYDKTVDYFEKNMQLICYLWNCHNARHNKELFVDLILLMKLETLRHFMCRSCPLCCDKNFMLKLLQRTRKCFTHEDFKDMLAYVPSNLSEDKSFVEDAMRIDVCAFECASEKFRDDTNFVTRVLKKHKSGWNWEFISDRLKSDRSLMIQAMKTSYGEAFKFFLPEFKADRDIVSAALRHAGIRMLNEAHPKFRSDREVILNAYMFCVADEDFPIDKSLLLDRAFVVKILRTNGELYKYLPEEMRNDRYLTLLAIKEHGTAYCHAPYDLKMDPGVAIAAIKSTKGKIISELPGKIKLDMRPFREYAKINISENPSSHVDLKFRMTLQREFSKYHEKVYKDLKVFLNLPKAAQALLTYYRAYKRAMVASQVDLWCIKNGYEIATKAKKFFGEEGSSEAPRKIAKRRRILIAPF